ncbi:ScbA/BarX family gamma-butyrolactone biosynthesis protein [Streptomyces sp. C11-1]|uniref:ScbA/BarX family gamma-butyrolactone biosynthesis protein n=1 Tax=Streptomyces durocortorensis TaxID=2811104 RepID=A0ABY9VUI4_9ACTN|nr:ScbA/BarX family gamma-butyrolactone biosynthesis protein [Streptomyces durocortorensis]WNF25412.1 ScbA/BarX family gamma-butyrolactone biosynthesis protein [Streptomyces durocortorensis]
MTEAAVLIDPVPAMDSEAAVVHPVGIEMVHRSRPEDAFPQNWVRLGHDRFSVEALLPHDHPFFAPVAEDRHDPLLVAEAMRQAAMLAFHAGYGVPLGHHFLMADLEYVCHPEHLAVGGGPTAIDVEVYCSDLKWRGGLPAQGRVGWAVHRGGRLAATGTGATRFTTPKAYRRIRQDVPTEGISIPRTAPVPASRAGRTRAEDVVLSETGRDGVWGLRVDTRHPTLFQRPNDHVPGMLLLEAARQAACLVAGGGGMVPAEASTRFHRYAEFGSPCWIRAVVLPESAGDTVTLRVTGNQDGKPVFSTLLSGPLVRA